MLDVIDDNTATCLIQARLGTTSTIGRSICGARLCTRSQSPNPGAPYRCAASLCARLARDLQEDRTSVSCRRKRSLAPERTAQRSIQFAQRRVSECSWLISVQTISKLTDARSVEVRRLLRRAVPARCNSL